MKRMMLKMAKGLMLMMMPADRDVRMLGEGDANEACNNAVEEAEIDAGGA